MQTPHDEPQHETSTERIAAQHSTTQAITSQLVVVVVDNKAKPSICTRHFRGMHDVRSLHANCVSATTTTATKCGDSSFSARSRVEKGRPKGVRGHPLSFAWSCSVVWCFLSTHRVVPLDAQPSAARCSQHTALCSICVCTLAHDLHSRTVESVRASQHTARNYAPVAEHSHSVDELLPPPSSSSVLQNIARCSGAQRNWSITAQRSDNIKS